MDRKIDEGTEAEYRPANGREVIKLMIKACVNLW
jgi:hypothetical protein